MELKYLCGKHVSMRQIGSNCTFMELKLIINFYMNLQYQF